MKIVVLLCLSIINVFAAEGKILYDKHCLKCHQEFIPMSKLKENFLDHNNTLLKLKAPTLNQLSYRLKQRIGNPKGDIDMHRMEVTAFMSDYVINPNKNKSVCLDDVIKHFETMTSLKGKVSDEELEEIGTYLYDFDNKIIKEKSLKYEGFQKALTDAKKEHKIIMIKVMSKDCHYCRKMDREVMIEKEIIKAIKKDFIAVNIDISKTTVPLGIKTDLTPSFIFVTPNKKVLLNIPGAWNKTDFLDILHEAKKKYLKKAKK